jgi:hypothetical protein
VRLPNQNPNELAGSEVRPQPPHCDKNSYTFESPPFQCCADNKTPACERQPLFHRLTSNINLPGVLDAEEVRDLPVITAIVNHKISNLPRLK